MGTKELRVYSDHSDHHWYRCLVCNALIDKSKASDKEAYQDLDDEVECQFYTNYQSKLRLKKHVSLFCNLTNTNFEDSFGQLFTSNFTQSPGLPCCTRCHDLLVNTWKLQDIIKQTQDLQQRDVNILKKLLLKRLSNGNLATGLSVSTLRDNKNCTASATSTLKKCSVILTKCDDLISATLKSKGPSPHTLIRSPKRARKSAICFKLIETVTSSEKIGSEPDEETELALLSDSEYFHPEDFNSGDEFEYLQDPLEPSTDEVVCVPEDALDENIEDPISVPEQSFTTNQNLDDLQSKLATEQCGRNANFSQTEIDLLLKLTYENRHILYPKFNSGTRISHAQKAATWKKIAIAINLACGRNRTERQLRKKFTSMPAMRIYDDDETRKSRREANFSYDETLVLLKLFQENKNILLTKTNSRADTRNIERLKFKIWTNITNAVNKVGGKNRSQAQIRKKISGSSNLLKNPALNLNTEIIDMPLPSMDADESDAGESADGNRNENNISLATDDEALSLLSEAEKPATPKRKPGHAFTDKEIKLIVKLVKANRSVLFPKEASDGINGIISRNMKTKMWEQITSAVNKVNNDNYSVEQVQKKLYKIRHIILSKIKHKMPADGENKSGSSDNNGQHKSDRESGDAFLDSIDVENLIMDTEINVKEDLKGFSSLYDNDNDDDVPKTLSKQKIVSSSEERDTNLATPDEVIRAPDLNANIDDPVSAPEHIQTFTTDKDQITLEQCGRDANFSKLEKDLLLKHTYENRHILYPKLNSGARISAEQKTATWKKITTAVNLASGRNRTEHQLRKKFTSMQALRIYDDDGTRKRKRDANFSYDETQLMFKLFNENRKFLLTNTKCGGSKNFQMPKLNIWNNITNAVNKLGGKNRSLVQIRKKISSSTNLLKNPALNLNTEIIGLPMPLVDGDEMDSVKSADGTQTCTTNQDHDHIPSKLASQQCGRAANFSQMEIDLLLKLTYENRHILYPNLTSGTIRISYPQKTATWNTITTTINLATGRNRTERQMIKKFSSLRAMSKYEYNKKSAELASVEENSDCFTESEKETNNAQTREDTDSKPELSSIKTAINSENKIQLNSQFKRKTLRCKRDVNFSYDEIQIMFKLFLEHRKILCTKTYLCGGSGNLKRRKFKIWTHITDAVNKVGRKNRLMAQIQKKIFSVKNVRNVDLTDLISDNGMSMPNDNSGDPVDNTNFETIPMITKPDLNIDPNCSSDLSSSDNDDEGPETPSEATIETSTGGNRDKNYSEQELQLLMKLVNEKINILYPTERGKRIIGSPQLKQKIWRNIAKLMKKASGKERTVNQLRQRFWAIQTASKDGSDSVSTNLHGIVTRRRRTRHQMQAQCQECNRTFKDIYGLRAHQVRHIPKSLRQRYICEKCGDEFLSERAVKFHMVRIHKEEPPGESLVCHICGRKFLPFDGFKFRKHVQSHHGQSRPRAYMCDICGQGFFEIRGLKTHANVHSAERLYQCEFCAETYKYERNLSRHRVTSHKDLIPAEPKKNVIQYDFTPKFIGPRIAYPCEFCEKAFPLRSRLTKHLLICKVRKELQLAT